MTDRNIDHLHPLLKSLAEKFISNCAEVGIKAFITQTYRSDAEQDVDYAQGRTAPGAVITNAKGGQSPHNCVLLDGSPGAQAFDFAIENGDDGLDWDSTDVNWRRAIAIGEQLGLISGSKFCKLKDCPHFELVNWARIA